KCDVDAAVGGHGRNCEEIDRARRDLSRGRPMLAAVVGDAGKDRFVNEVALRPKIDLRPCDDRVAAPPGGQVRLVGCRVGRVWSTSASSPSYPELCGPSPAAV